jgi:peptidoglycan/LPS O-acetylase OafA/YrhL
MLTQIALTGVIFYKRYILRLPASEYDGLNWIVGFSMGGYWAARLYFSGI